MKANSLLWIISIIFNIIIILVGISLLISGIYLSFKIKEFNIISGILLIIGVIIFIVNSLLILIGKFRSWMINIGIILNSIIFLAILLFSIMITINFDKTVNFLFEISELKNEDLISTIKEYIQIIIIVGFCLAGIIVLDLVCLFFYKKSILNEKEEYSQELTSGDPILRKLKGLEDSNL